MSESRILRHLSLGLMLDRNLVRARVLRGQELVQTMQTLTQLDYSNASHLKHLYNTVACYLSLTAFGHAFTTLTIEL